MYDRARRDAARRREQAQERRQIRETQMLDGDGGKPRARRRSDRHVEGVSFDTEIAKKSPDVKELTIDPPKEKTKGRGKKVVV